MQGNMDDSKTNICGVSSQAHSNKAIENVIAALRGNGGCSVEFVLLASLANGPLLSISSDGLRHAKGSLLSENFKNAFIREQGRQIFSSNDVPQAKRQKQCSKIDKCDTLEAPQVTATNDFIIGDDVQVDKYLYQLLRDFQQNPCKGLAKASIKTIEPKKQTNYPYTGGSSKVPPWWPQVPPKSKEKTGAPNCVRHKEPDHQYKKERIQLIVHIMRIVADPHHPQRTATMRLLTIKDLKIACFKSMAALFNGDTLSPSMSTRRKETLKEFFRVLKLTEKYKNGGLDASTLITVGRGNDFPVDNTELISDFKNEKDGDSQGMSTRGSIECNQGKISIPSPHQMEPENYHHPTYNWDITGSQYVGHGALSQQSVQHAHLHTNGAFGQEHIRHGSTWRTPFDSTPNPYLIWAPTEYGASSFHGL